MGRRTRDYEASLPDKLLSLFQPEKNGEAVWLKRTELRRRARAIGFTSNATFDRYLGRLVVTGILVNDGKYYHVKDPGWYYPAGETLRGVKAEGEADLCQALQRAFVWVLYYYTGMLRGLVKTEDKVKAREIISFHMTSGFLEQGMLTDLARVILEHRKKVPLEALGTMAFTVSLRKDRQGRLVFLRSREKRE